MITDLFPYNKISRETVDGSRKYLLPDGSRVASVTTILDATKSEEKKQALNAWRQRVGEDQARQIVTEAAGRGTRMHKFLEQHVMEDKMQDPGSNPYSQQSHRMAEIIVDNYLKPNVDTFYGSEVNLYYPGLYAGTTDCVARWRDRLSILDFKQTNKPKKTEWVQDYFLQLAAYAMAHNELYNTNIQQGVILMCSATYEPQHWVVSGLEFQRYCDDWCQRVEQFYK
jgi:genome maintenance exonuclease 1